MRDRKNKNISDDDNAKYAICNREHRRYLDDALESGRKLTHSLEGGALVLCFHPRHVILSTSISSGHKPG